MAIIFLSRQYSAVSVVGFAALLSFGANVKPVEAQSDLIQDGKVGYVVSDLKWGVSNSEDPEEICPDGLSIGPTDIYAASQEGQRREGETDAEYTQRLREGTRKVLTAPTGENLCMHPEAGEPDPHHPIVETDVKVYGIDLDDRASSKSGEPAPGACPHNDLSG